MLIKVLDATIYHQAIFTNSIKLSFHIQFKTANNPRIFKIIGKFSLLLFRQGIDDI